MNDPAVWGPLLITAVLFALYYGIDKRLEVLTDQRREHHNQVMDILNTLPDELDKIQTQLDFIDDNTKPSADESLGELGDIRP